MAIKHKPTGKKRRRAQALADRLKRELELSACEPLLTAADAGRYGEELARDSIKFHLALNETSCRVQLPKQIFFSDILPEDYYFRKITHVWLSHLKAAAQEAMAVFSPGGGKTRGI